MKVTLFQKLLLIFVFTGNCQFSNAQSAKITGSLRNAPNGKFFLTRPAFRFTHSNKNLGWTEISLNENGKFNIKLDLKEPEIMKAFFNDSAGNQLAEYNFYLSPGDNLKMGTLNETLPVEFKVTGIGANNNQPLAVYTKETVRQFDRDTLPERAIAFLQEQNKIHQKNVLDYIAKYRPSPDFITAWKANLQYEVLEQYFNFATNNAYAIDDAYERNYGAWNNIILSLYKDAPLVNAVAVNATTYKMFLSNYLLRTKESLWESFRTQRGAFLHEWYGNDTAAGAALFVEDKSNDLQQRIIEKTFTGKPREYLYAVLINGALDESEIKNLIPIYQKFKMDFPSSSFIPFFESRMNEVWAKKERKLTPGMKFIDGSTLFKNWEDILAYYKGQTVLLDMWGTWCGPCRQDMDRHSAFIKQYFKGKPLRYVYIANFDTGKEKIWKELIAYFNLEGDHFIADKLLTKDIMAKVKGQGYPTYVIIRKDGTFELYERGYGINRDVFTAQVERALRR